MQHFKSLIYHSKQRVEVVEVAAAADVVLLRTTMVIATTLSNNHHRTLNPRPKPKLRVRPPLLLKLAKKILMQHVSTP